ncbi:MAG: hypothetical protein AAF721_38585 [Myxococcota bacterium]
MRLSRRALLRAAAAVAAVGPALGFARPDTLPGRKAVFEEIGNSIMLTLSLPTLFRRSDTDALASIDSGFDTTVRFKLDVWEHGTRKHMGTRVIVRKIRRDPWKKKYVVRTQGSSGWSSRSFAKREEAIAEVVALDRVRVIAATQLQRGGEAGPFYFVTVLAQRNPIEGSGSGGKRRRRRRGGRRDLEWFGHLVDVLAGEQATAEETLNIRTNPFFLVPR